MEKLGRVVRKVTNKECPWLGSDLKVGQVVFEYSGCTFGTIAKGVAVSNAPGETPFFEVPKDAIVWVDVSEIVKKCTTIDDVRRVVETLGGVSGSSYFFTYQEFNSTLNNILAGQVTVEYVTRAYGLREKVAELLLNRR